MNPSLPNINAKQLRAVAALASYGSFVAAAAYLDISQPALTRTIKQIESVLGVALFTRSTRHVALTAAGREFVPLAERLLGDLALGVRNMRELADRQRGHLVIAALMSIAYSVLPGVVAAYRARYPAIRVQLRENVQAMVFEDVRTGVADFGIGDGSTRHESVSATFLREETFHVVMPRDHPMAGRRAMRMRDLRDETIISLPAESGIRGIVDAAAIAADVSIDYGITVNQFATLYRFIREGLGVAVAPVTATPAAGDPALVSVRLNEPRLTRRLALLTRRDRALSPAAKGFLDLLRPAFKE